MGAYTARRPKEPLYYDATLKIYNYLARDLFLWVFYCLCQYPDQATIPWSKLAKDKNNYFDSKEKKNVESIHDDFENIRDFDIAMLLKIIQACCGLKDRDDPIWTSKDNSTIKTFEAILRDMKQVRNKFAHDDKELAESSLEDFVEMVDKFIVGVDFIVFEAMKRSKKNIAKEEANAVFEFIRLGATQTWENAKLLHTKNSNSASDMEIVDVSGEAEILNEVMEVASAVTVETAHQVKVEDIEVSKQVKTKNVEQELADVKLLMDALI